MEGNIYQLEVYISEPEKTYTFVSNYFLYGEQMYFKIGFGEFLVELANLKSEAELNTIKEFCQKIPLNSSLNDWQVQDSIAEILKDIVDYYLFEKNNSILGFLIASEIWERLYNHPGRSYNYVENINSLLFPNIIYLPELNQLAISLLNETRFIHDRWDEKILETTKLTAKVNNIYSDSPFFSYFVHFITDIIALENINIRKNNIVANQCENCGRLFIPRKRSDEIYCNHVFKNGKTCSEIGYEQKLKNDAFKSAYRKAYKTQHARIRYNSHISDYEEKHFIPWNQAAKKALKEYQSRNDLNGFLQWLESHKNSFK